ncbi:YdcF family protein [Austwickia chelonae]|uniref:YdcF family protein n=1 Tax=Austwickia chelonae TaxID=100225 RepID=UPI000E2853D2|nr:YdcF family protein [Austwickia chelonae]
MNELAAPANIMGYIAVASSVAALVGGVLFVRRLHRDTGRIGDGFLALFTVGAAVYAAICWALAFGAGRIVLVLLILADFLVPWGILAGVVLLFVNGARVIRREGIGSTTVLPVAVATAVIVLPVALLWSVSSDESMPEVSLVVSFLAFTGLFFGAYLAAHLVSYLVYAMAHAQLDAPKDAQVVVTLGAGLAGDRVTPLLAARLDRALQVRSRADDPANVVMVVSGGQGRNELVSEAAAMAAYLQDKGVPAEKVLLEDRSTTTEENLTFTDQLLALNRLQGSRVVVCTNDFHAIRVAVVSRRLRLGMQVVGAPTAGYYRPAAFLREFVALLKEHWLRHLTVAGLIITGLAFLAFLTRP